MKKPTKKTNKYRISAYVDDRIMNWLECEKQNTGLSFGNIIKLILSREAQ